MKKLFLFAIISVAVMMGSCGNKEKAPQQAVGNDSVDVDSMEPISVYGTCGSGSAMNTLQIISDNGDTLNFTLSGSKDSLKILGGYDSGDRMALLLNADKKTVRIAINETTMLGEWWQPNPIDGTSYMGINFKDGGTAESLDQNGIVYKSWRIVNGKLAITYYREGGTEEDMTDVYDITKLDGDSLIFGSGDDVFELGRKHTRPAEI